MATRLVPALTLLTDYTSSEETTYAATLGGAGNNTVVIFNTTLGKVRVWNGSAFVNQPDIDDLLDALKTYKVGQAITSSTSGVGYGTGAGGTVTQGTSRTTTVVLNKLCGNITMFSAAQASQAIVTFTLTNSFITATDYLAIQHISATNGGAWNISCVCGIGSATITIRNISSASITEATPLKFTLIKGSIT